MHNACASEVINFQQRDNNSDQTQLMMRSKCKKASALLAYSALRKFAWSSYFRCAKSAIC